NLRICAAISSTASSACRAARADAQHSDCLGDTPEIIALSHGPSYATIKNFKTRILNEARKNLI
ncbi:MAG: hypothetical protein EBT17_00670, partial [Actinobacteria bacterium]|nr:hypothetical protein [Actinomycetota bacterium]